MRLPNQQRADARMLYARGWTLTQIAQWLNCTPRDLTPWIYPYPTFGRQHA